MLKGKSDPLWPFPFPPEPINRVPSEEKDIWDRYIDPIVRRYELEDLLGRQFKYRFIEKEIDEKDLNKMVRKTTVRCSEIVFPKKDAFSLHESNLGNKHTDDDGLNFYLEFVDRLNDPNCKSTIFPLVDGGQLDILHEFRDFLNHIFANDTLPEFIEMLRRDISLVKRSKSEDKKTYHQKGAKSKIIDYAYRRSKEGRPLVSADFKDRSNDEIARISSEDNVTLDTLRKYVSNAGLLKSSKTGRKPTQ